jgi:hypothetical protein
MPASTFKARYAFKDGLSKIKINDKYGFINKEGQVRIACQFDYVSDFHQGFAIVKKKNMGLY